MIDILLSDRFFFLFSDTIKAGGQNQNLGNH